MWYLKKEGDIKAELVFYLEGSKEKYTVGRRSCNIYLEDDISISREHAWLYPEENSLKVVDKKSKYGVFVNGAKERIQPDTPIRLNCNDQVTFGMFDSKYVVGQFSLRDVMGSYLSTEEKDELKAIVERFSGKFTENPTLHSTHLTMNAISTTIKLIVSLQLCIPCVTMDYWRKCLKSVKERKALPDPADFTPPISPDEIHLSRYSISLVANEERKTLFKGKTFYFMVRSQIEKFGIIVELGGGKHLCVKDKQLKKSILLADDAIVIQHDSGSSKCSQAINSLYDFIRGKGSRMVPETEIYLAVLHCSIEKYCNPKYFFEEEEQFELVKPTASDPLVQESSDPIKTPSFLPESVVEVEQSQVDESKEKDAEVEPMVVPEAEEAAEKEMEPPAEPVTRPKQPQFKTPQPSTSGSIRKRSGSSSGGSGGWISKKPALDDGRRSASPSNDLFVSPRTTRNKRPASPSPPGEPLFQFRKRRIIDASEDEPAPQAPTVNTPRPRRSNRSAVEEPPQDFFQFGAAQRRRNLKQQKNAATDAAPASQEAEATTSVASTSSKSGSATTVNKTPLREHNAKDMFVEKLSVSTSRWISCADKTVPKAESESAAVVKQENEDDKEYLKNFERGIIVRIKQINLATRGEEGAPADQPDAGPAQGNVTKKNFKKFVKNPNIRRQQTIVETNLCEIVGCSQIISKRF